MTEKKMYLGFLSKRFSSLLSDNKLNLSPLNGGALLLKSIA